MREIKFRAWDKEDEMMYWDIQTGISFEDGSKYAFYRFLGQQLPDDYHRWEVMQFTGLSDANEVEIWEGDILGYLGDDEFSKLYYDMTASVIYNEEKARFEIDKSLKYSHKDIPDALKHEFGVIGNIYDNPGLLK